MHPHCNSCGGITRFFNFGRSFFDKIFNQKSTINSGK
jgi:hypothetical protein